MNPFQNIRRWFSKDLTNRYQQPFAQDDNEKNNGILQATVMLEDAINFRSIFHKVDRISLIIYRCYYSNSIQLIISLNIFAILMLAFVEKPSSISLSSDITMPKSMQIRHEFPCNVIETVDLFCLILFAIDCCVKSYLVGSKRVFRSPWLLAYYIVLIVSFIDLTVTFSFGCSETLRLRRYLRPFFLIQCSSLMKKTIKCLRRTLPQIISVFVLLVIHIYFFAIIGMLIFPRYYFTEIPVNSTEILPMNASIPIANDTTIEKNHAFNSIVDSIFNLVVLVTSSNNPDIMMQSYSRNRITALYFVIYVMIGIYCIMSLITAVIYNQFKGFFQDSMQSSSFRQAVGIRASFWILNDKFKEENNRFSIPKQAVACAIQNLTLSKNRKEKLLQNLEDLSFCIQDSDDLPSNIELFQYEKLFFDHLNGDYDEDDDNIIESNSYERRNDSLLTRIRNVMKRVFLNRNYMLFSCLVTIVNIICITMELHFIDLPFNDIIKQNLSYAIFMFSIYYVIENLLKIWSINIKRYCKSYLRMTDGIISLTFLVLQIIHFAVFGRPYITFQETYALDRNTTIWSISRVVNMLLIFRLIHLAPSVKVMYAILSTTIDIIRSLRPVFGIMICNYYWYSLLGMQLFANTIQADSFNFADRNKSSEEVCGSYAQLKFWANNFNDFFSALVVLWDIMVVNNWQIIIEAFVSVTSEWHRLYFIFWWILCTVITLNVCISLILDLFILKWEKSSSQFGDQKNLTKYSFIKSIHRLFCDSKWRADETKLHEELKKHRFIDFDQLVRNANTIQNIMQ